MVQLYFKSSHHVWCLCWPLSWFSQSWLSSIYSQEPPSILGTYSWVPLLYRSSDLCHQHTVTYLVHPLVDSVTTSTTTVKRKGDSTDPCCIPTLTLISSDNSQSTLTLGFAPSYRLITDITKTSGVPFFLNAHSNAFLVTLWIAFSRSTKHIYNFFSLAWCSSGSLLKVNTASIVPLSCIEPNCISPTVTILWTIVCILIFTISLMNAVRSVIGCLFAVCFLIGKIFCFGCNCFHAVNIQSIHWVHLDNLWPTLS